MRAQILAVATIVVASMLVQPARSQQSQKRSATEIAILKALASNPTTAPFGIQTSLKDGRVVLSGRVGTKEIHDNAMRLAMAVTPSIDDRLVIDTAVAFKAATPTTFGPPPASVYPPPLFGRLDNPFLGFEPPLIAYPPWWRGVAARKGDPYGAPVLDDSPIGPDPGPKQAGVTAAQNSGPTVEMTIDPQGVALLRGWVPNEEARVGLAEKASRMEGVSRIINELEVDPNMEQPSAPIRPRDVPPPPPQPEPMPEPRAMRKPPVNPQAPGDSLQDRVTQALGRRPVLNGSKIDARVQDGEVTLTGNVATAIEAMTAFRAAQQTVGVRSVVDRLAFTVPDGQKVNPLIARARPDDVEPYLEFHIRRQLAEVAQIDRVKITGDRLEIRGTIRSEDDRARTEAILRSIPLLRGFSLEMKLIPE